MPVLVELASLRVSEVIAIEVVTALAFIITIVVPISNATDELAGIVMVCPVPVT